MAVDPKLTQLEEENGLVFGLKWSAVGVLLALCILAGCSSFLSAETPRYNTVVGERRVPAMNQSMMTQQAQQAQQAALQPVRPPAPQPPQPFVQQAPIAPSPQPVAQPAPQPLPPQQFAQPVQAPAVQEPSMIDQVGGVLWSGESEREIAAPYPTLPPNTNQQLAVQPQQPLPPTMTRSQIEAEITALENELQAAQQQQAGLSGAPVPAPMMTEPMTTQAPAPLMGQPMAQPQAANVPPSLLLPPPPAPRGPVAAPVISDQAIMAHSAQAGAPVAQPQPVAPIDVPLAPTIQSAPTMRVPSTLIPPDMQNELSGAGYLPPSRYQGRY